MNIQRNRAMVKKRELINIIGNLFYIVHSIVITSCNSYTSFLLQADMG